MPADSTDVLIVGGGVIGLAAAWKLASQGASVRLIDSSGARGASWVAAGMLAPASEATFGENDLTRLNLSAVPRFSSFVAELEQATDLSVGLREEGTLLVARDADDRAALARLTEFRNSLGLTTTALTGSEVRKLEPFLAADVRSGVLAVGDLSVNNRLYVVALQEACRLAGVDIVIDEAAEVDIVDGRARGVSTNGTTPASASAARTPRTYLARTTVVCTGSGTSRLLPNERFPVHPVKGQILRLSVPERLLRAGAVLTRTVRGIVRGSEIYLVPREGGEIVIGATSEQQGWDTTVTAGGIYQLLRDAYELAPIISELQFVEALAGLRPGTPDNGPIVGATETPGLIVSAGHYRNGILLSALSADAVAALIAGEPLTQEWTPFRPSRFRR
jgi:glycine oxidase